MQIGGMPVLDLIAMGFDVLTYFVGTVLFRTLRYIPLFIGAWILTWTTVLEANSISTADRRFDLENHALLVNTFFFSVPILFVVLLVTFDVIADRYWVQVLVMFVVLFPIGGLSSP